MFCKKCGSQVPQNSTVCPNCQTPAAQAPMTPPVKVKSNMGQAIIVTLFCCLPLGIVAIVYAAKVSGLVAAGNIPAAQDAARKSNMWSWIGLGVGLIVAAIYVLAGMQ